MPLSRIRPHYRDPKDLRMLEAVLNAPLPVGGYSMPQLRTVAKTLGAQLQNASEKEVWAFWEKLWKDGESFEEKTLALIFWSDRKQHDLAIKHHKKLLAWAADITCWPHSDSLSSLYARLLETLGAPIDLTLKRWNSHKNPWLRRQSIVSLLYYTRERKKTPSAKRVLDAIKPLLADEHYYVQKGIGWTLREVYQVDAKLTLAFIEKNLHLIHPDAYSASVEKVSPAKRAELRNRRSAIRKGSRR